MPISESDFRTMQDRCNRGMKKLQPQTSDHITTRSDQKEVGRDGIQEQIESWLMTQSHRAWWDCKRTDRATTSRKGVPDFVGVFAGVAFGIEVKKPGGKPTIDQLGELTWMRKAGAKTAVVYSKEDAVNFFNSIINEKSNSTIEGPGVATPAETRHPDRVSPEADVQAAPAAIDRICAGDRPEDLHHQLDRPLRPEDGVADDAGAADAGSRKESR
jgi:hypothetical protein